MVNEGTGVMQEAPERNKTPSISPEVLAGGACRRCLQEVIAGGTAHAES